MTHFFSNSRAKNLISNLFIIFLALPVLALLFSMNAYSQILIGGNNYSTLYDAFNAINTGIHTGNINIQITGDIAEASVAQLNSGSLSPANYSSVTIKPTGSFKISASHGGTILYFNGASNVTIDGSKTSGGTTQDLIFQNNAASSVVQNANVLQYTTTYGGCILAVSGSNISVKNTQLYSNALNGGWGVNFYSITNGTIDNCWIKRTSIGVFAQLSTNITITNNIIGSTTSTDMIGFRGIAFFGVNTYLIKQNEIVGLYYTAGTANASARAITIHTSVSGGLGTSTNGLIDKNRIHNIKNTVTGAYGICLQGALATDDFNTMISNNLIYDLANTGNFATAFVFQYGINVKMYHNTVNLYLASGVTNTPLSMIMYNLYFTGIDLRNNIFRNNITSNPSSGDYIFYFGAGAPNAFTNISGNNYTIGNSGSTGYFALNNSNMAYSSDGFSSWKTYITTTGSGNDSNSTITNTPVFVADDNVHLSGNSLSDNGILCDPIPASGNWDAKDFDVEARRTGSGSLTFRGADEVYANLAFSQNLTSSPVQTSYCDGSNVSLNFTSVIASYKDGIARTTSSTPSYGWYKTIGTTSLISGQTNNSLSFNPVRTADSANYFAYAKFLGDSITTNTKTLKIETAASISVDPQDRALCSTAPNLQLTVSTLGTVTNYQWQKETPTGSGNFQNIAGQNKALMSISLTDPLQATGNYRVIVYGGSCTAASVTSKSANVTVAEPLGTATATINSDSPSFVCTGNDLVFKAQVASGTILGYQWQKFSGTTWTNIDIIKYPDANTPTLTMKGVKSTESGLYRCLIFGSPYCVATVPTNSIDVRVWDLSNITLHPKNAQVCLGGSVTLSCGGDGKVNAYQWQKDEIDINISENSTAHSPVFVIATSKYEQSGSYRCKMTVEDCRGIVPVYTNPAAVHVASTTVITEQPVNVSQPFGSVATFTFDAHVNGKKAADAIISDEIKVQWYKYESDSKSIALNDNMPRISGSKSNYLTINNFTKDDLGKYWAQITGLCGTVKTNNAELLEGDYDLTIVQQPKTQSNCEGTDLFFIVEATTKSNKLITYQWYYNGNSITDMIPHTEGALSYHLTIYGLTKADIGEYYCIVSLEGTKTSKQSDKAQLNVSDKTKIVTQPQSSTVPSGGSFSLTVAVADLSDLSVTYQWMKDGQAILGATNTVYTKDKCVAGDEGNYWCIVKSNCGDFASNAAKITITSGSVSEVTEVSSGGYSLSVPTPSPVNDAANIRYFVPNPANVKITFSDMQGSFETQLVNEIVSSGEHFVTINTNKMNLSSGTYFLKLESNGVILVQKVLVIK